MDTQPKDNKTQTIIEKYISQMSPSEKGAYSIAEQILESSFDMEKSIGFLEFLKREQRAS